MRPRKSERSLNNTDALGLSVGDAGVGGTRSGLQILEDIIGNLPTPSQAVIDGASGFGDGVSFGITKLIRRVEGIDNIVDECSSTYGAAHLAGVLWGVATNLEGYATGYEIRLGKNLRIAPWGNRTDNPNGELPHYHRRTVEPDGSVPPDGGIKWHRPWEKGW